MLFVFIASVSFAQTFDLSGNVTDATDNTPLVGMTVSLTPQGSSVPTAGAVTDSVGKFFIVNIPNNTYTVKGSYIGYKEFQQTISGATHLNIRLQKDVTQLANIVIEETPPPASQRGDTTQYNAGAFKTNPDATSEDLVNKIPGVTNDGGTLKHNGEEVKRVLVDGKEFFGDDPSATLKNLPADVVDKIKVFDQGSEQSRFTGFNDGNTNKVLNIVTKANKRNGTFGNFQAGIGTNSDGLDADYYIGSATLNMFKDTRRLTILGLSNNINQQNFSSQDLSALFGGGGPRAGGGMGGRPGGYGGGGRNYGGGMAQDPGIATTHAAGINYSNEWKKLKYSGSYFMNYQDNDKYSETQRDYFTNNDSTLRYNDTSNANTVTLKNRFTSKLEYEIDSNNSVVFAPRLNLQRVDAFSSTNALTQLDSSVITNLQTINDNHYDLYTASGSLDYRHKFAKKGRTISLNGTYDGNGRTGDGVIQYVLSNDSVTNDTTNQTTTLKTNGYTVSGTLAYTEPVGKNAQMMLSYTPSYTNNVSDKTTYDILNNGETQLLDTTLTNSFDNTFTFHRGSLAYQYNKDKLNFSLEAQYQNSQLHGEQTFPFDALVDRNFDAVLPQAQLNYKFTDTRNLRFNYRSSMNAPNITQLQNVIDVTNPLLLTAGNPNLKPETQHNAFVRYGNTNPSQNTGLFLVVGGTYTQDYIGRRTLIAQQDTSISESVVLSRGSQLSYPVNFDYSASARSFVTYTWGIKALKSNLSAFTGFTYSNTPAIINNLSNRANQYNVMPGLSLSTNFSQNFDASIGYNATYSLLQNSLPEQRDNRYFQHTASLKINWITFKRLVLNTQLNQQFYNNLSDGTKTNYTLWNAYVGYKMLKDRSLELRASVNDILNQNNTIAHTQTETYVEDTRTLSLRRYYMLSLVYTLKAFGSKGSGAGIPSSAPSGTPTSPGH